MRHKLFPNIKRMTGLFCAGIILITVTTLALRLTVLSGMAEESLPPGVASGNASQQDGDTPEMEKSDYLINTRIYFSAPDAKGNILITNTDANPNYIRVDIKLDSTGKSVYYSGYIAPGTSISNVRLQGDELAEGVYECTASISAYDPVTKDKIGSEDVPVMLYIGVKPGK